MRKLVDSMPIASTYTRTDLDNSFYVGDAASRRKDTHHSDGDHGGSFIVAQKALN